MCIFGSMFQFTPVFPFCHYSNSKKLLFMFHYFSEKLLIHRIKSGLGYRLENDTAHYVLIRL